MVMPEPEPQDSLEKGYLTQLETERPLSRLDIVRGQFSHAGHGLLRVVRPAFLNKSSGRSGKLRRTAYLDGVRGIAAFSVYWLHHELWSHEGMKADRKLENAWGYEGEYYLAAFPFLRTFFTGGHYGVAALFVISGYVLSTKPLSLMNAGEHVKLGDNLASALFRRWLRLWLPIFCTTFITFSMWHIFGVNANFIPEPNYRAEIWKWYSEFKNFTFVFTTGGKAWLDYNPHTWSIPIEMRASVAIYTALMAFSRCTRRARLWCEVVLMFYFMYIADGAQIAMFIAGMFLCDVDFIAAEGGLPNWMTRLERVKGVIFHVLLVISVYLGGAPSYDSDMQVLRDSPGWHYLSWFKPQAVFDYKWFYLFWASTLLITCAGRISWLKRFFETSFCQYMGRISFMFYLVHGPILWMLGDRVYAAVGFSRESHAMTIPGWENKFKIPRVGPFGMELNFWVPQLLLLPVTFWVAEIATTVIDDNVLRFVAWLYKRTLEAPADKQHKVPAKALA